MQKRKRKFGLSIRQAFSLLKRNGTLFIVGLLPNKEHLYKEDHRVLQGAWREDGRVYIEPSVILTDDEYAVWVGVRNKQMYLLGLGKRIIPSQEGFLYLLPNTERNRTIAIAIAGGYTADKDNLLVFSPEPIVPALYDYRAEVIRCKGAVLPVVNL